MSENYTPIDCNFYDRLEAWSTLREKVTIRVHEEEVFTGVIKNLFIKDKIEFLLLDSGIEIRLDLIVSVNEIPLDGSCEL